SSKSKVYDVIRRSWRSGPSSHPAKAINTPPNKINFHPNIVDIHSSGIDTKSGRCVVMPVFLRLSPVRISSVPRKFDATYDKAGPLYDHQCRTLTEVFPFGKHKSKIAGI